MKIIHEGDIALILQHHHFPLDMIQVDMVRNFATKQQFLSTNCFCVKYPYLVATKAVKDMSETMDKWHHPGKKDWDEPKVLDFTDLETTYEGKMVVHNEGMGVAMLADPINDPQRSWQPQEDKRGTPEQGFPLWPTTKDKQIATPVEFAGKNQWVVASVQCDLENQLKLMNPEQVIPDELSLDTNMDEEAKFDLMKQKVLEERVPQELTGIIHQCVTYNVDAGNVLIVGDSF